jgi:hypothetical protein
LGAHLHAKHPCLKFPTKKIKNERGKDKGNAKDLDVIMGALELNAQREQS